MSLDTIIQSIDQHQKLADKSVSGYRKFLGVLQDFYHFIKNNDDENTDAETITITAIQPICDIIAPPVKLLEQEYHDEHNDDTAQHDIQALQNIYHPVVSLSLEIFSEIIGQSFKHLDQKTLLCLATAAASLTDDSELWSSDTISTQALALFIKHKSLLLIDKFLIDHLLRSTVKPLFGPRPATITDAGRKAIHVIKPRSVPIDIKPWRDTHPETLTLLKFTVQHLDDSSIEESWPLIVPPILTSLDTGDVLSKYRGCQILSTLLLKVKPEFLERTGLDQVFWEAVMPCLHFLPPLTPAVISCRITDQAFDTLIKLAVYRKGSRERMRLLNKVMREGVYQGLVYAGENVKVVELLTRSAVKLVDEMEISAVSHLDKLLSLCNQSLTAPFATSYPPLLLETARMLIHLMKHCWPRIDEHKHILLRGVCLCWLRIAQDEKESSRSKEGELERVKEGLREVVMVFQAIVEHIGKTVEEDTNKKESFNVLVEMLIEKNQGLSTLFMIH